MTEQEIITAAKTNWLAWQGLKELQPEVAAWMEGHEDDLLDWEIYPNPEQYLRWCKPKPDIAQLRRDFVEARARMMDATDAYLDAKHRLDGALRVSK
jgi:hypothetical protein